MGVAVAADKIYVTYHNNNRKKKEVDCILGEILVLDMNMYEQYCEDTESENTYSLKYS